MSGGRGTRWRARARGTNLHGASDLVNHEHGDVLDLIHEQDLIQLEQALHLRHVELAPAQVLLGCIGERDRAYARKQRDMPQQVMSARSAGAMRAEANVHAYR